MPEQNGEKSQEATPHRKQQAREQGQVARSQDLGSAVILVTGLVILLTLGAAVLETMAKMIERQLGGDAWLQADLDFILAQYGATVSEVAKVLLPVLGLLMLAAVLSNLLQVGFLMLPDKLAPDISRISLLKGVQRLFSVASVVRMAFSLLKIALIATIALVSIYGRWEEILALTSVSVGEIALFMLDLILWTCLKIGIALLILALLDYAFQRWKHSQDLKMTSQEVREEYKNLQGDPQIIARRRQVQRQLALNRLSSTVPEADVVVTNPTELAVAIQYKPEEMLAPIVLVKGEGLIAQRIRRIALENNVPIVENKPLAQQLYREVDAGKPVPDESYAAVAEVLAYVYQLKGKPIPKPPGQ